MNKRVLNALLAVIMTVTLIGCKDRLDLEDVVFPLAIGLDLDKNNNLTIYDIHPVFTKNVKKKNQEIHVTTSTIRMAKEQIDAHTAGIFQGRKTQVFLISKKILQQDGWFPMTDVFFRDAKNPLTPRVIVYNGPLSDIFSLNPPDEPILPVLLRGMVDTKSARSETVSTTMQKLHWQMYEKGITPCISEIALSANHDVTLHGTTLLTHKGKFAVSFSSEETVFMSILQKNAGKTVSISISAPDESKKGPFDMSRVSFDAKGVNTKIKSSYMQNKFHFDIRIKMPIVISELLFPFDLQKNGPELEKIISRQVQKQFESIIQKIQKHKIDPIGLGRYARAHHYSQFKKAEDRWGEELAKADIRISVKITIEATGPVK
ncbi:Ger(x)C family spore germination protein [Paenibacillus piri]|nr:Ger(x)C family spore germination protein [Paenibacillus piri]